MVPESLSIGGVANYLDNRGMQVTQSEFTAESLAECLQVEICKIDRITPYALHPGRHDEAVDQMGASLLEYGLKLPLLVHGDGELVDGHLRCRAATKLGFQVVSSPAARNPLVCGAPWLVRTLVGRVGSVQPVAGSEPDRVGGEDLDETVTGHGAPKPVGLMKRPILSHTERWDSVYGPFLGPSTTVMAAKLSGGSCLDVDSAPRCADVTARRGEPVTGHTATTAGDGRSFTEMARLLDLALDRQGGAQ
jgi:ParB-like nuclease domain